MHIFVSVLLGLLVLVLLSKAAFGARRMTTETRTSATVAFSGMRKWYNQSLASKSKMIAHQNAVFALAYANVLRATIDDAQSQRLFNINALREQQKMQQQVDKTTADIVKTCPALSPSAVGGRTVRAGNL